MLLGGGRRLQSRTIPGDWFSCEGPPLRAGLPPYLLRSPFDSAAYGRGPVGRDSKCVRRYPFELIFFRPVELASIAPLV